MIEGVVFTALRSLVNDRCYPGDFPQEAIGAPGTTVPALSSPTWPAIRYTVVSGFSQELICGTDTVDTDDTRVQIDVVASTHGGMIYLRDQVIAVMQSVVPPCARDSLFWTKDAETKTFRCVIDFVFHPSTGSGSP